MRRAAFGRYTVIFVLVAAIVTVELILSLADYGWIGSTRWRTLSYQFAAFWPGLLGTWQPNFAGQPTAMFLSYTLVHAGPDHAFGNAIVMWILGTQVTDRVGKIGTSIAILMTSFGAAFVFFGMSNGLTPMIGASGVVFGLAGVLLGWAWQEREPGIKPASKLLGVIALLVLLNVVLYNWYEGGLAWQSHLGGFVVGFGLSRFLLKFTPS